MRREGDNMTIPLLIGLLIAAAAYPFMIVPDGIHVRIAGSVAFLCALYAVITVIS